MSLCARSSPSPYTEKAAAELKARVLKMIAEKTASSAGDDSLQAKLETIREEFTTAPHLDNSRILRANPARIPR